MGSLEQLLETAEEPEREPVVLDPSVRGRLESLMRVPPPPEEPQLQAPSGSIPRGSTMERTGRGSLRVTSPSGETVGFRDVRRGGFSPLRPPNVGDIAEREGISTKGAPASARSVASFGGEITPEIAKIAVARAFGKSPEEIEVRTGPETGVIEFVHPETGETTLFNPPGVELGDIAGLAGGSVTTTGDISGAIGGSLVSPGAGTVAGGAVGASIGEYARLKFGQSKFGLNRDKGDLELARMAITNAGVPTAIGGALVPVVLRVGRNLISRESRQIAAAGASGATSRQAAAAFGESSREAAEVAGEISARTGRDVGFTSGQVAATQRGGGEELYALEKALLRGDAGDPIRLVHQQQEEAFAEYFEAVARDAGIDTASRADAFSVGRSLQESTRRRISAIEQRAARRAQGVRSEQEALVRETVLDRVGSAQNRTFGASIKEVAKKQQQEFSELEKRAYSEVDDFARTIEGVDDIPVPRFNATGAARAEILDENVLRGLSTDDRAVMLEAMLAGRGDEALEGATKNQALAAARALFGEATEDTLSAVPAGRLRLSQINSTLSVIRTELRKIELGLSSNLDASNLRALRSALLEDRRAFLKDHSPALLAKIEEAERFVAVHKDLLDRSIIGDIVRVRGGREAVVDERVFDKIISPNNATETSKIGLILREPIGEISEEDRVLYSSAMGAFRKGILSKYEQLVIRDGVPNPAAHKKFMRDFVDNDTIAPFFSREELAKIRGLGGIQGVIDAAEKRAESVVALARRSFPGTTFDVRSPKAAFNAIWGSGDETTVREAMRTVRKDPQLLSEFRAAVWRDMRQRFSTRRSGLGLPGTADDRLEMDFRRVGEYLKDNEGKLSALFGDKYVSDLRTLERALTLAQRKPPAEVSVPLTDRASALRHLLRAYVGLFTVKGRFMTAGILLRGKSAEQTLARVMADPEALSRVLSLRNTPISSTRATAILGGLGAWSLTDESGLTDPRQPRPTLEKPLFGGPV